MNKYIHINASKYIDKIHRTLARDVLARVAPEQPRSDDLAYQTRFDLMRAGYQPQRPPPRGPSNPASVVHHGQIPPEIIIN